MQIFKLFYVGVHNLQVLVLCLVAFTYLRAKPIRAQLICFMLAANIQEKRMHSELFNDSVMVLFIFAAFYSMQRNWPRLASAMVGISLTIKAGGVLLFPPLLGWI